ncbi:OLC1v1009084C10 [Oldenlandia corymbosa var. corymbosa]|uniref:OLC1v1009084C10 n=1 Tax=Oldenlandia corymbosa var. corymbosa TaxID=529605 RepID=A0AAV1DQK7_OLDCO|nr:OLC1v1009084C10 [Oldenlandia corymbosa var. corymbosa]
MSAGVVSSVLNQIATLVVAEANLLGGLQQEIQGVVDELEHMKAFLMFAEDREEEDPSLQVWISQVRDVAYDIEDVVGEFLWRFNHNYGHGFNGHVHKIFVLMKNLRARRRIAQEIQLIKSRITSISASHERYQSKYDISNQASTSSLLDRNNSWNYYRDAALFVEAEKLVGIDRPKQQLIYQLLDGDSQFKVVSVLGMGGIGKTTLVKKVHEDVEIKKAFQILAWVTVSETWDTMEVLKDLIKQLYKEIKISVQAGLDSSVTSTRELKAHVKEFLKGKRYLIVFDDVWDSQFWESFKFVLPEGSCGNRVILTTRNANVGNASSGEFQCHVHEMEVLSLADSWTLFCKKTFKGDCCPTHLESIAERILKKCGGLPLAIVAIGGLLASKDKSKINEWEMVERNLDDELGVSGNLNPVTKILSLSYIGLPHHLKTCLLYASIFPEDYRIAKRRLIRLWIAEGLVLEKAGMSNYEIAQAYLDELTNRSLIQVAQSHPCFRLYHIHDILREIVLSKSSRQNFATIVTEAQNKFSAKVRRLAIHDLKSNTKSYMRFKCLRSLVIFNADKPLPKYLSGLLAGGSKLLKVLDLEGTQLDEIPEEVFKLLHLKTLNLSRTRVRVISKSIGSLKNLEYLDLRYTEVSELPEEILNLEGLVHLTANNHSAQNSYFFGGFRGPNITSKLISLEWLYDVKANEILIKEIGDLKQLRRLGIASLRREHGKQLCSSLGKLFNLEHLYLYTVKDDEVLDLEDLNGSLCSNLCSLHVLRLWGRLGKVPEVFSSLHELTLVHLRWSGIMDNPLESLQYLPNLLLLMLEEAFEGESLCFKAGCFLKLGRLGLYNVQNLRWLRMEEGAMPNLRELELRSVKLLEEFPWEVQHLTKLEVLYLEDISQTAIDQLHNHDQGSGECNKISHIHKILTLETRDGRRNPRSGKQLTSYTIRMQEQQVADEPSIFVCKH